MKRFTMKSLVVTAALAAAAVSASAQSLSAEIPFNFRAGDAVLAAGTYRIHVGSADFSLVRISNMDTGKSVVLVPRYQRDVDKNAASGAAKLWFECTGSSCVLNSLWNGAGSTALVIGGGARRKEVAEIRVVNLTTVKGE